MHRLRRARLPVRAHWRGFETDDPDVTMFIGPSTNGEPLEVGVVDDVDGVAIQAAQRKYADKVSA